MDIVSENTTLSYILNNGFTIKPIKHGKWEFNRSICGISEEWKCSECGCEVLYKTNYCPCCGTEMD